ncbi:prolipoprotein diacylglyceryl transferase [Patescibacteria group bacterium]
MLSGVESFVVLSEVENVNCHSDQSGARLGSALARREIYLFKKWIPRQARDDIIDIILSMFLHTYTPQPILFKLGPVKVYWYGFLIVIGILIAFFISQWLLKKYKLMIGEVLKDVNLIDLSVYLLIGGLIGARVFHIIAEWNYYFLHPLDVFKIWNGGLWIYGAIYGGFAGLLIYSKRKNFPKKKISFLLDLLAPGIIFAQAIGRWGNYFNQELYGLPTKVFIGLPIEFVNRVSNFSEFSYFHPVFFYESIWCLAVGLILIWMHFYRLRNTPPYPPTPTRRAGLIKGGGEDGHCLSSVRGESFYSYGNIFLWYIFLYSFGRALIEFIRIDTVPLIFGIRSTQVVAILFMLLAGILIFKYEKNKHTFNNT